MRKNIILFLVFVSFLFTIPRVISHQMVCLMPTDPTPREYESCNLTEASNRYLTYGFLVWIVAIAISFLYSSNNVKELALFGIMVTVVLISSYYLYLGSIKGKVLNSPVYLDTLYKSE